MADAAPSAPDSGHPPAVRLADHPRAARSIPRVRSWAALIGFGVTVWVGQTMHLPFVELAIRAILIGMAAWVVGWLGAQAVWRQIIFAEIAAAKRAARTADQELTEQLKSTLER